MASCTSAADIGAFKKSVKASIISKYTILSEALKGPMESYALHMHEAHLIDRETMRGQKYDDIMGQFISGMDFKHSISEIQDHCRLFTDVLDKLGGPTKMAGSEFTKECNTLIPQQQCLLFRGEVDGTHYMMLLSIIITREVKNLWI